ncbi:hypothetical protein SDC9_204450 [bioreactor metagenome]|uniref:Uncharacterized protein n=1 Tax=bioreactor metagenome TaxID=1076179 RepID=A0A645IZA5_9ZZZZ
MQHDAQQIAGQRRGGALGSGRRCRRVGLQFAEALDFGLGKAAGLSQTLDQLQAEQRRRQLEQQGLGFVDQAGFAF